MVRSRQHSGRAMVSVWRRVVSCLMLAVLAAVFACAGIAATVFAHAHSVTVGLDQPTDDVPQLENPDICPVPGHGKHQGHGKHCVGQGILGTTPEAVLIFDTSRQVNLPGYDRLAEPENLDPPRRPPRA
ncbi:MAG: hypothetical protein K2X43_14585 [Hyphomonadaceae bacterium]|jgi:hypothetical protein|nr:hypothetical protein [Hyphomonadaceae bacterium]